jgi:hypothetical protein
MGKRIPVKLLLLLENWFNSCVTCVKWGCKLSKFFRLTCGIRQGGVLSPYLFAIYIDSVVEKVKDDNSNGCHIRFECCSIFLYADDIIILSPSVTALQSLLRVCEDELEWLDMTINAKKSACMRIGPQWKSACANITTKDGRELQWVETVRYLGVFLVSAQSFKCCFHNAKRSFYMAFNAIFGKVGRTASEDVILSLIASKCLPAMFYGLEACPLNSTQLNSLEFALTSVLMKVFATRSKDIIDECMYADVQSTNC